MRAYALIPRGRNVFVEIGEITPAVLYDDRCRLCARFAGAVGRLGGNRILLVGHYSPLGERIRRSLLGSDALDMFWFIDSSTAYGGRAGLLGEGQKVRRPERGGAVRCRLQGRGRRIRPIRKPAYKQQEDTSGRQAHQVTGPRRGRRRPRRWGSAGCSAGKSARAAARTGSGRPPRVWGIRSGSGPRPATLVIRMNASPDAACRALPRASENCY